MKLLNSWTKIAAPGTAGQSQALDQASPGQDDNLEAEELKVVYIDWYLQANDVCLLVFIQIWWTSNYCVLYWCILFVESCLSKCVRSSGIPQWCHIMQMEGFVQRRGRGPMVACMSAQYVPATRGLLKIHTFFTSQVWIPSHRMRWSEASSTPIGVGDHLWRAPISGVKIVCKRIPGCTDKRIF